MEGEASANEGAAPPGGANGCKDAEEAAANQQPDDGSAVANGDAPLHESANEGKRGCGSANQDAEAREVTNDSKETQAANEDTACKASTNENAGLKAPTNENAGLKAPTNENAGHKAPANQDKSTPLANHDTVRQLPTSQSTASNERQAPPLQDPTNDLTPLAAAANQTQDPWDWSLEEAWLRAPEEEGLEAWGAELEGWEEEPDEEEEEELEDWEVELEHCGVELMGQGAELKGQGAELKGQGAELEVSKGQGVELECCEEDPKVQGAELDDSRGHGVGLNSQGAGPKGQRAELRAKWADPSAPEASHWLSSPDGAWSKLTLRAGRGLARPGPGSLCRVRLSVPGSVRPPWPAPAALSGCGRWLSVRLGSAEGRWSALLDAGLETMTSGELAWLRPLGLDRAALSVRLGRFTPAPSFWAVPPSVRWPSVASGHARAAHLLRRGQAGVAAQVFRRSLRAAVAAAGPPPVSPAVTELKAELHAGLAAAQIRLGLPAAAAANAGKALELRPAHLGARYARGVACAAMMDLEAAREDLLAVLRARPGHAGATRELGRVRDKARERDTQLATRLGKMFA